MLEADSIPHASAPKLPDGFRDVRLELAREPGDPDGHARRGFDLLVPLDDEAKIVGSVYRAFPQSCRARRFRPEDEGRMHTFQVKSVRRP